MGGRILILMCDSGGGHRSVADAIAGALDHLFPGRYECQLADIMADGFSWPLCHAGRMYGPIVNRFPRFWGLFWHLTNGRRRAPLSLRIVSPLAKARLARLVLESEPALIVSTHPWANYIPAWLFEGVGRRIPLVTVVTDPVSIHHWWLCPDVDLCLVPTEQARDKAVGAGVLPERVEVIGIPVDLKFLRLDGEKGELRKSLGVTEALFTVLIASGGDGMGQVLSVARAVGEALLDVQLLVVTGRNEGLRRRLERIPWQVPVRILGFVRDMPGLMQAADLIITKAGPSTISEALACGLPILISGSLPGQENGNAEWVVASGAALFTPTPEDVVAALRKLVRAETGALDELARHARQAAKPHAALQAARVIDQLLEAKRHATHD